MNNQETSHETGGTQHPGEFKIHFHMEGGIHRMSAIHRHKAEGELLALLKEVSTVLGFHLDVETQAYGEGGVVEYLNLVVENKENIAWAVSILGTLLGAPFYLAKIKQTKQQTLLNELNIQKAKLEIKEKEKAAADDDRRPVQNVPLPLEPPPTPDAVAQGLLTRKKIARRRSNYYAALLNDSKIQAIGFSSSHEKSAEEKVVTRDQFGDFVIAESAIDPLTYTHIPLEIVSPVLKSGAIKWRGIFEKKIVSFELQDESFRELVSGKRVQFQNGTTLICDFEVLQREDDTGEIEIAGYAVTKVHEVKNPEGGSAKRTEEQLRLGLPDDNNPAGQ